MNHTTHKPSAAKAAAASDPLAAVATEVIRPDPQPLTGAAEVEVDEPADTSDVVETVLEKPVKNPAAVLEARTAARAAAQLVARTPAQRRRTDTPVVAEPGAPPPVAPASKKWRLMNDVKFSMGYSFVALKAGRVLESGRGEEFFKRLKAAGGLLEEVA